MSVDAQQIGQIRELLSGGHGFIALRRDQIEWLLQRVEQAEAQNAEQAASLAHWQHCHAVTADKLAEAESALAVARQELLDIKVNRDAGAIIASQYAALAGDRDTNALDADLAAARLRFKEEKSREVPQVQAEGGDRHRTIRGDGVSVPEVSADPETHPSEVAAARLRGREEPRWPCLSYFLTGAELAQVATTQFEERQKAEAERETLIAARDVLAKERDYLRDVVAEQAHAITEKIAARDEAEKENERLRKLVSDGRLTGCEQKISGTPTSCCCAECCAYCADDLRDRANFAEAEIARLSSQLAARNYEIDELEIDGTAERLTNREVEKQLRSQLAGMREALTEVRSVVALNAAASHMLEGFTIGPNGLPAARPRRITHEDALLAKVDAALHAAQGSQTPENAVGKLNTVHPQVLPE